MSAVPQGEHMFWQEGDRLLLWRVRKCRCPGFRQLPGVVRFFEPDSRLAAFARSVFLVGPEFVEGQLLCFPPYDVFRGRDWPFPFCCREAANEERRRMRRRTERVLRRRGVLPRDLAAGEERGRMRELMMGYYRGCWFGRADQKIRE